MIVYTRECLSCDKSRQSIIFKQLCSNNQLSTPIRFLIEYSNLSFIFSDPVILYTSYIPIQNITIITRKTLIYISINHFYICIEITSTTQIVSVINNNVGTNGSTQISNSK